MRGFLLSIATFFAVLKLQQCTVDDLCILYKEMCRTPNWCPGPNEYMYSSMWPVSFYQRDRPRGNPCKKCPVYTTPIDASTNMRVISSPSFMEMRSRYRSKLHAKYNLRCDSSNKFMYCKNVNLDIRGKDCCGECRDYLMIDLAQRGYEELCEEPGYQYVVQEGFKATFRTNYHEEDANKKKCEEGTWITGVSGDYYKGFQVYCMCLDDESSRPPVGKRSADYNPVTNSPIPGVDNGCKQKSGTFSTDLFPDYPKYRLAKDLDTFHRQWRRMVEGSDDKELIIEYILYNQTVKYCDGTISILEDGVEVKRHRLVKFIKTFDLTGEIGFHIGRQLGSDGDLSGPGPLVIACKCGFFQSFVIDTRDIFPNELETPQLNIMIEPFLSNQQPYDRDEYNEQLIFGSDYNYTEYFIEDPTIMPPRNTTSFNNDEEDAVIVAYLNENACNPVLREQSKVTIGYFSGINRTLAETLLPFSMSCSVRCRSLTTGEHVIIVQCTSQSVILPGNTTCTVGNNPSTQCDPFSSGGVEFPEDKKNSILVVTSVNILGQRGMLFLSL